MNKLYILTGIIILQSVVGITAADYQNRPIAYRAIDDLIEGDPIQWPVIFNALDTMPGAMSVDNYRAPDIEETLLETAVHKRNLFAVETLLNKYHADPNLQKDYTKLTPLMISCMGPNANPGIVRVLIRYGANPYLQNRRGQSSFNFAGDKIKIMAELDSYKRKNR